MKNEFNSVALEMMMDGIAMNLDGFGNGGKVLLSSPDPIIV